MDSNALNAFFWKVFPYCVVGGLSSSFILAFFHLWNRSASWETRSRSGHLIFATPLLMRLSLASLSVSFLSLALGGLMQTFAHPYSYLPAQCTMVVAALLILALGVGGLFLSGTRRLDLDLERRCYTYTWGAPLFPRRAQGPFEDIKACSVRATANARGYQSLITWRVAGRPDAVLDVFAKKQDAATFAKEMLVFIRAGRNGAETPVPPCHTPARRWRRLQDKGAN